MEKHPLLVERARWLIPAALLGLTPKCAMCILAYAGLSAALGLGGPELCGASIDADALWPLLLAGGLSLSGLALSVICQRTQAVPKSKPVCWTDSATRFSGGGLKS